MVTTFKGRIRSGVIVPLEPLTLPDMEEVTVTLAYKPAVQYSGDPTEATFGAWKDLLDCEAFERDIYVSRLVNTRGEDKVAL